MSEDRITLSYGSGGAQMHRLIDGLFMKELNNPILREKKDAAILNLSPKKLAFTTDSYVVNPIFFPGGDIGSLAVYGTVNDLSVCGARPMFMSLGLVIEEGLSMRTLERIVRSIALAAKKSDIKIVTGDTKVVEKGACDGIFINTSGIGEIYYDALSIKNIRTGDSVIVSGTIGDHAISVLSKREGISFGTNIKSDSAPLYTLIRRALDASGKVAFMRDPTRGGLATTLNEIVSGRHYGISIDEESMPIKKGVRAACELLGLDPLYLACEGRAVLIAPKSEEKKILNAMRRGANGEMARAIGMVTNEYKGKVYLNAASGGRRIIDMLSGDQLPRIC